jgi:hypothetical protein
MVSVSLRPQDGHVIVDSRMIALLMSTSKTNCGQIKDSAIVRANRDLTPISSVNVHRFFFLGLTFALVAVSFHAMMNNSRNTRSAHAQGTHMKGTPPAS